MFFLGPIEPRFVFDLFCLLLQTLSIFAQNEITNLKSRKHTIYNKRCASFIWLFVCSSLQLANPTTHLLTYFLLHAISLTISLRESARVCESASLRVEGPMYPPSPSADPLSGIPIANYHASAQMLCGIEKRQQVVTR